MLDLPDRSRSSARVRLGARSRRATRLALPLMLAPILWLLVMGLVFAIVDFAEDGILGNARVRD